MTKHIQVLIIRIFFLFSFFALANSVIADAGSRQSYVITIQHQLPETMIPAIQPLLAESDGISAYNHELIVTTDPQRIQSIRELVSQLDKPLRNLLITVKNNNNDSSTDNNSGFSGGIRQGKVFIGTGEPVRTQREGLTVRSEGLGYSTNTTTRSASTQSEQQVRAIEGSPAFIYTGESRLFSTHDAYGNSESTEVNANKGFYVTARITGDRVQLELFITNDEFNQPATRSSQAAMSTQRLSTTISGSVGEWISLSGLTLSDSNAEKSQAKKITTGSTRLGDIAVKIAPLDR